MKERRNDRRRRALQGLSSSYRSSSPLSVIALTRLPPALTNWA